MMGVNVMCYISDCQIGNGIVLPFEAISLHEKENGCTYTMVSAICGKMNTNKGDEPARSAHRLPVR